MNKVTLTDVKIDRVLDLKYQLDRAGLTQPNDFTWQFTPRDEDWMNGVLSPSSVTFEFSDARHASFYRLKWT